MSTGGSSCARSSSAPSTEILVNVVEDGSALGDSLLVVLIGHGDARNEVRYAGCLLAPKLAILEINVVDDLGDSLDRRNREAGARQQGLEAATIGFMRELAFEHIEAQLAFLRDVAFARHEADDSV